MMICDKDEQETYYHVVGCIVEFVDCIAGFDYIAGFDCIVGAAEMMGKKLDFVMILKHLMGKLIN